MSADHKAMKQDSLPFPPTPSASIAGRTMQESVYKRRVEPRRLPAGSPNILIVLIDDAGPAPLRVYCQPLFPNIPDRSHISCRWQQQGGPRSVRGIYSEK
jgi:hypothetical protein